MTTKHTVLEHTRSLCPRCLEEVEGRCVLRGERVWLERSCDRCGDSEALLSANRAHYHLRHEVPHQPKEGETCACSPHPAHRTCVAILEITRACDLGCPACFAQAPAGEHRSKVVVLASLEHYLAQRGPLDVLQLSGGEPLLHPDLLEIVDAIKATGQVRHLMINTNGLALARDPSLAAALAERRPALELYLQLDAVEPGPHARLRGRELLEQKRRVLELVVQHDLPTTLVCTVAKGVNEHALGDLLRLGTSLSQVRGISFQPATWSGRFDLPFDPGARSTVADVVRALEEQTGGRIASSDLKPLPCSHPNCCTFTFLARPTGGEPVPLTRLFDYDAHVERFEDRMLFTPVDDPGCCGPEIPAMEVFRIVIKHFMDAWNYDLARSEECCTHLIRPDGSSVSFCHFNTLERGRPPRRTCCSS